MRFPHIFTRKSLKALPGSSAVIDGEGAVISTDGASPCTSADPPKLT
jgi:hypothetical protein